MERIRRTEQEPLDAQWYRRFEACGSFQAYKYYTGDKEKRDAQKRNFFDNSIENPVLDYPTLHLEDLIKKEVELLALKKDILTYEKNREVQQVYRWKINEKIAELRMMKATLSGDMRRFSRYTAFVYGEPTPEVFAYTVAEEHKNITRALASENPEVVAAAQAYNALLPDVAESRVASLPVQELVDIAHDQTVTQFSDVLDFTVADEGIQSAESIAAAFTEALQILAIEGWTVVQTETAQTSIHVDQEHKIVKVPKTRKITAQRLQQLIAHEIGTHVLRRHNGERSRLQLLGLGLDRYEKAEEGIAKLREQAILKEVTEYAGFAGHFSISLARGLDNKPRNFREVFSVLQAKLYLEKLQAGIDPSIAKTKADEFAWKLTLRAFQGTDGKTAGVCFTKDLVYREGNIDIWTLIGKDPNAIMQFNLGKYDPTNLRHIAMLSRLGITESELDALA